MAPMLERLPECSLEANVIMVTSVRTETGAVLHEIPVLLAREIATSRR